MAVDRTITSIRAAVKAQLATITDIGNVHERQRQAQTLQPDEFATLFIPGPPIDQIRTWIIDVTNADSVEDDAGCLFVAPIRVQIDGYVILDQVGNSQVVFDNLLDLVLSKLRGNTTIFGDAPLNTPEDIVATVDFERWGEPLCHHVLIEFMVETLETV